MAYSENNLYNFIIFLHTVTSYLGFVILYAILSIVCLVFIIQLFNIYGKFII